MVYRSLELHTIIFLITMHGCNYDIFPVEDINLWTELQHIILSTIFINSPPHTWSWKQSPRKLSHFNEGRSSSSHAVLKSSISCMRGAIKVHSCCTQAYVHPVCAHPGARFNELRPCWPYFYLLWLSSSSIKWRALYAYLGYSYMKLILWWTFNFNKLHIILESRWGRPRWFPA
jgi:hypothetical protein